MSNLDINRPFEDIFTDTMYSIIRDANITLSVIQLERFQATCKRSARLLRLKLEQETLKTCDSLQGRVKKGFEKVGDDLAKLEKIDKHLHRRITRLEALTGPTGAEEE